LRARGGAPMDAADPQGQYALGHPSARQRARAVRLRDRHVDPQPDERWARGRRGERLPGAPRARGRRLRHEHVARGRARRAPEDLEAALLEAGGENGLAAAFVEPLAKPVERVLFGRRLGAYVIDMIIVFIGIGLIQQLLDFTPGAHLFFEVAPAPPLWRINSLWYPWGQDPTMSYGLQALFALASGAWVIGYFAWTEAHGGRSLGKRALH